MHNVESLMIRCDSNPWEKSPKFAPSIFFLQSQLLVEGIPLANWQEILGWSESGSLEKPWGFCIETSASLAVVTVIAFKRYCCLFGSFYHFWSHAARIYKYPEIHFVDLLDACTHKSPWNRLQFFGFQQNHGTKNHRTERPVKPNSWSIWSGLDLSRRRPTRLGEVFFHVPHPIFIKKRGMVLAQFFFEFLANFEGFGHCTVKFPLQVMAHLFDDSGTPLLYRWNSTSDCDVRVCFRTGVLVLVLVLKPEKLYPRLLTWRLVSSFWYLKSIRCTKMYISKEFVRHYTLNLHPILQTWSP